MYGRKLRDRMQELGLTQADLVRATGFSRQYVSDLCHNRNGQRMPYETVERLSKALRVGKKFFSRVSDQPDRTEARTDREWARA